MPWGLGRTLLGSGGRKNLELKGRAPRARPFAFHLCRGLGVDSRLGLYHGHRLVNLRKDDCPQVAVAIVGHVRKQCRAFRDYVRNQGVIRIEGRGVNVVIRAEDWAKIVPYLRDGTFNPVEVPVPKVYSLNPNILLDVALLEANDSVFYQRVLGVLEKLFPEEFPTSNL